MFLYTELLYRPLFNLLVLIYNYIPGSDLGVAIIILTLVVRIILYPLNRRAIISQRAVQTLQPKVDELKEKYKDDREKMGSAMMELYKKEKINPLSSCLPIIIQLPILFAVYQVFMQGLNGQSFDLLYPGVVNPESLNTFAFGFLDLAKRNIVLAVLAGAAQFWQTKMLMDKRQQTGNSTASIMSKQMLYMMPIMTVWIGAFFPAGLTLYWLSTTIFSALQQVWMIRRKEVTVDP